MKPALSLRRLSRPSLALLALLGEPCAGAEPTYDEKNVPDYSLPDPLLSQAGAAIEQPEAWRALRRPELIELFRSHVYGRLPDQPIQVEFEETERFDDALGGKATLTQITARFTKGRLSHALELLLFVPNAASTPAPAFLGLNFRGNQSVHADPRIRVTRSWVPDCEDCGFVDNQATEASRGAMSSRWPIERIIDRGYAFATIYYGDLDPDFDDGFRNGIHPLLFGSDARPLPEDAGGAIAAWAWGLSRGVDYLSVDERIDSGRIAVVGHSRLGKAALWAAALDERIALVVSNESGCGGAALSRRRFGETVARINTAFPHWFAEAFKQYNDREETLPIDQHLLLALIAPRGLYVASAAEDLWADPQGEFLSLLHAMPVYRLLGGKPLPEASMPAIDRPLMSRDLGYHIRSGRHDLTAYDWEMYLGFADRHFAEADRASAPRSTD